MAALTQASLRTSTELSDWRSGSFFPPEIEGDDEANQSN
jgi:hypothetical protein